MSNKKIRTRGSGGRFASTAEAVPLVGANAAEVASVLPDLRDMVGFAERLPVYNATFEALFDETGARR